MSHKIKMYRRKHLREAALKKEAEAKVTAGSDYRDIEREGRKYDQLLAGCREVGSLDSPDSQDGQLAETATRVGSDLQSLKAREKANSNGAG
jgi:hypothetical protein